MKDTQDDNIENDDVEFEDISEDDNVAAKIKNLREKLKTCEKERQEFLDGWQRARADVANTRREYEEDRVRSTKFAKKDIVVSLLPALDSFGMAFSNKEAWEKADKNWRTGVEYIYSQLIAALREHGVEEYDPTGEVFDPNRHESIETVETNDESEDHKVLAVVQKGYALDGAVIRPAKVKVGQYVA